ncbi:hypothetical protein [Niveispirillum cyanobacteriorum]|uniref:Uncharacterized protein n=1 Tax=Niveispirillum cyanobacteriorum TaxID=1612173 RepID=A0A2K9NK24_9PROT|nr:hypothetical protein [Niveispirillum cyanobacteriorum]AUN33437.1 hypothetical protein C0V82_24090 [Niveispirillum cyanobacteriorum]GGE48588.1 hypothetical protein GCM10011317_03720 [Niveispirillum cyanobacteriorum]
MFKNKVLHRLGIAGVAGAALLMAGQAQAQQKAASGTPLVPTPAPMCAVSPSTFQSWLAGTPTAGNPASFVPPNSATFTVNSANPDCSFYQWGQQMFLWLMSPNASGTLNLYSPSFYNVIKMGDGFNYVQNPATPPATNLKAGALPKIPLKLSVRVNKPIGAAAAERAKSRLVVNRTVIAKVTGAGAAAATSGQTVDETGQADGGVLVVNGNPVYLSGSSGPATYPVVYYGIAVNDVFNGLRVNNGNVAYFNDTTNPNVGNMPVTLAQAQQIQTASSATFADINQLAVEVKTSWVDAAYVPKAALPFLIQGTADVPAFTSSTDGNGNLVLTWDGTTMATRTLALIGMHVVGSVAGHPEMVWATFESKFNAPDNSYFYYDNTYNTTNQTCTNGGTSCVKQVPFIGAVPTLLYNGKLTSAPTSIAQTASSANNDGTINSVAATLVPTNVVRLNPWGSQQPSTAAVANSVITNNTNLLSLDLSVDGQLLTTGTNGPVLASYTQVGSIWSNGVIPFLFNTQLFGSLYLANTTMETFEQSTTQNPTAQNCFTCHSTSPGATVSHVFN